MSNALGKVIAERRMKRGGTPRSSQNDWCCPYEIRGLKTDVRDYAMGIDSMQALQLAFVCIRLHLVKERSSLFWLSKKLGLGFPKQLPEDLGDAFEGKIERLVEAEWKRRLKLAIRASAVRESKRKKR